MHARWVKRWDSKALGIERHVFSTEPISAGPGNRNGFIGNLLLRLCTLYLLVPSVLVRDVRVHDVVGGDSMLAAGASGPFLNSALRTLYSGKIKSKTSMRK